MKSGEKGVYTSYKLLQSIENPVKVPAALREAAAALPHIYTDPEHYDLLAQMTAPEDLPFHRAMVLEYGGPVLDLGCGTGRIALELAREGADVTGVELSAQMLERALEKAEQQEIGVTLALGDLREFDLERIFSLIVLGYNTLNHLLKDDDLERCLATIRRHMDERSVLVIDTFQPSLSFLGNEPEKRRPILRFRDPYLEKEMLISEENHYEPTTQINRIVWSYAADEVEDTRVEELSMRLFFPRELDTILKLSGFVIEVKYGNYDRSPFGSTSPKQLFVLRRADSMNPDED